MDFFSFWAFGYFVGKKKNQGKKSFPLRKFFFFWENLFNEKLKEFFWKRGAF